MESVTHVCLSLTSGFPSHLGPHRALSRVPCALQFIPFSGLFIHSGVHMSAPVSQFIPSPSPLGNWKLVFYTYDYFCFANKFVCIIFQDSRYKWHYMIFVFLFLTSLCMTLCRSIHVVANGINPFLFVAESCSTVYMYHIFIHSSVHGHLGCFYVLAIVNSAIMNTGVFASFQIMVFSRYSPGVGLLGHMVALFLFFKGTSMLFSIVVVTIHIPTSSVGGFLFLHTF